MVMGSAKGVLAFRPVPLANFAVHLLLSYTEEGKTMRKHDRRLPVELRRPPVLLVGFVVKTIYRTMFEWWLDPRFQRKANQSLLLAMLQTFLTNSAQ